MPIAPPSPATAPSLNRQAKVRSWKTLLLGAAAVGIVALSMHTALMQVLHVPYPLNFPQAGWPAFVNLLSIVLGTIWLVALGWPRLQQLPLATRCLLVVLLVAMLKESLLRRALMNGWVTTAWRYSYIASLPKFLPIIMYASCAVLIVAYCHSLLARTLAGIATTAVLTFGLQPALEAWIAALLNRLSYLNHEQLYSFPYGWEVEVPSYITFAEPVVAGLVILLIVWPQLSSKPVVRLVTFSFLIMLVRGVVLAPFINMAYDSHGPLLGFFSQLQFTLEALVLAAGLGLVWPAAVSYSVAKAQSAVAQAGPSL